MFKLKPGTSQILPASIGVGVLTGVLVAILVNSNWKIANHSVDIPTGNILGNLLMQEYVVVFELLGIILLIALIGAASMARR